MTQSEKININVDIQGIETLYAYIEKRSGISLQKSKILVQNHIIALCQKYNIPSFEVLLEKVEHDFTLWKELIDASTIHETYFCREKEQLKEALQMYKHREPLSILSAPSSSGEEAYSIAILALELGIKNFKIVGIDISETIIQKAKKSSYSKKSVHLLNEELLEKYFIKEHDKYFVKDMLIKYVDFIQYNLFEDEIYKIGKFDLIFSRNMFIYFNDTKKIEAYKRLEKLKKDNHSSIYLGHADTSSKLSKYIRSQS